MKPRRTVSGIEAGASEMLSIKHIEEGGCESVILAEKVAYFPKAASHPDASNPSDQVIAYGVVGGGVNGDHSTFGSGWVYVMNDHGKTIANYDLHAYPAA
jgi:hypothetical protein